MRMTRYSPREWERATLAEVLGTGSIAFGGLGLVLCWWFPFGMLLASCGVVFGIAAWLAGGARPAWSGLVYSAAGVITGVLLVIWDHWRPLVDL